MALNCIVYQAFDKNKINECRYSLLKFLSLYNLNPPNDLTIVIYTDQPSAFEAYSPFFEGFQMKTTRLFSKWIVLKEELAQFDSVLYCETNTYPLQMIEPLFEKLNGGKTYVIFRKKSQDNINIDFNKWRSNSKLSDNQNRDDLVAAAGMSNDETLSNQFRNLTGSMELGKADEEQILLFLSQHKTHFDGIVGYSELPEFSILLQAFFKQNEEESIPNLVKLIHHLDANEIHQQKLEFEKLPVYRQWLNRILGKGWSIKDYTKKL